MDFEGFQTLIAGLGDGDKNTALEVRNLFSLLLEAIYLPGDIKLVQCTESDLENDYTSTGLGIGKRSGWAQCNGLNGTLPYVGRVPVGYGDSYPLIGQLGGTATVTLTKAQVPALDIPFTGSNDDTGDPGDYLITSPSSPNGPRKLTTEGGGGSHSNMQPYVVTLYLVKI